jgi:shikimate dehydrogenase
VIPHLDTISRRARACGAVNTIVHRRGRLFGDNTDVLGLERAWEEIGVGLRLRDGVVLGAGGSARAVVVALAARCRRVLVAARRPERARALVRELGPGLRARLEAVDLADLRPRSGAAATWLGEAGLVVNATPAGMKEKTFFPFAFEATPASCFFYDLVYTAQRTPFVAAAARAKRSGDGGLGMLLHQGAAAFEIWTGASAPVEVMRGALRRGV